MLGAIAIPLTDDHVPLSVGHPAGPAGPAARAARGRVDVPASAGTATDTAASTAAVQIEEDARLAAACLRGEPGALERLVLRFQADVFGAVVRLVRERESALELVNSIFFKIHQNLGAYDASRPLRPWVLRIATNEALNWLRARRRDREHLLGGEASEIAFQQLPGGTDPEAAAVAAEQRETVRAALAQLPEHYRLVLTLRFFNDLSYQEIAEITGQEANTVGVQLLRARQSLKRVLAGGQGGGGTE